MSDRTGARATGRPWNGPAEATLREQWRHERRALVRRHHPDVGGDPEVLLARLVALDHRYRVREDALRRVPDVVPSRLRAPWRLARRLAHRATRVVPRRRRYIDI
jgi:hypothetical protein